jgi:hypothetical protein
MPCIKTPTAGDRWDCELVASQCVLKSKDAVSGSLIVNE